MDQISWENDSVEELPFHNATNISYGEFEKFSGTLPSYLSEISESSLMCVYAYCVVFVVATSGNTIFLTSLWKKYKTKRSRISLLLLNLSLADLIVCCTLIPTEVVWRLTIQWRGGNVLCKVTQFLRAFGLYLSSLVLICVSVDRFLAIVFPMSMMKVVSYFRIKVMLSIAWILAVVFSLPQAVFFGVKAHPEFPMFKQCVTNDFLDKSGDVKVYSIFSVVMMYFVPLLITLFTYSAIIIKLIRKSSSRRHSSGSQYSGIRVSLYKRRESSIAGLPHDVRSSRQMLQLRCSSNAEANVSKAKSRTLLMTVVIVIAFVFCWTPYAFMTLWYVVDWKGAAEVDSRIQDALFLMVVANSCVNPMIYRGFTYKCGSSRKSSCFCQR